MTVAPAFSPAHRFAKLAEAYAASDRCVAGVDIPDLLDCLTGAEAEAFLGLVGRLSLSAEAEAFVHAFATEDEAYAGVLADHLRAWLAAARASEAMS